MRCLPAFAPIPFSGGAPTPGRVTRISHSIALVPPRPRLGRPFALRLPSGTLQITLDRQPGASPRELLAAVEAGGARADRDLRALPLFDAHVVEAIAIALGAVSTAPAQVICRNCGEPFEVARGEHLPLAPLLDGAMSDPELDRRLEPDTEQDLPRAVAIGRARSAETFRLAPRTLADRPRLVALLGEPGAEELPPLPTGPVLVRAIGLSLGDVKSPLAIARALDALDDAAFQEVWGAIAAAWDETHYSPRLLAPSPCPACGARHDVEVPARLVLDVEHEHAGEGAGEPEGAPFPSLAAFRARAAEIAREELAKAELLDAEGLEIVVDEGVPPCDDGGEPLLGSYTPRVEDGREVADAPTRAPFEVALYYRTFASMHDEETYDVDAEIRETIAHELEHHQGFLAGDDPLDQEERAEIARERRRLYGERPIDELRAGAGWLVGDVARFFRATWPLWIVAAIATLLTIAASR